MVGRTFLGRYEAIRLLGEGGMGRVYLAKQVDLGRQVVVKVMHDHIANDPKFRERFQRETLVMASFQHPNVVTLFDASLDDPQGPCIVMEYIKGVALDMLLQRNGRMMPPRVGRLLYQLCEALQAAHTQGIVHRDLKPANLMVIDPDTPYETVKVMDFGLAKLVDDAKMAGHHKPMATGVDFAVGTPGYISPEQVRGEAMDHRSDLYSVGVILFELLTGKLPFKRKETMDVLLAHATEPPPSFEAAGARGWVTPAVENLVMRCLAKNPAERPAGARDLREQFEKALFDTSEPAKSPSDVPPPVAPTRPAANIVRDPSKIIHEMEAWMPDAIATYKLRGFVNDFGGEVLESIPGVIRVRLTQPPNGSGSWFFRSKIPTVDMELRLERSNPTQQNLLHITVLMTSPDRKASANPLWRERCNQLYCELRGYLAGASIAS
jgi:serine/threonine-protein kinase